MKNLTELLVQRDDIVVTKTWVDHDPGAGGGLLASRAHVPLHATIDFFAAVKLQSTLAKKYQRQNKSKGLPLRSFVISKSVKEVQQDLIVDEYSGIRFGVRDDGPPEAVQPVWSRAVLPRLDAVVDANEAFPLLDITESGHTGCSRFEHAIARRASPGRPCYLIPAINLCHVLLLGESRKGCEYTRPTPGSRAHAPIQALIAPSSHPPESNRTVPTILLSVDPFELLIELIIIWIVVYATVRFLRGTRGAGVVKGFVVLLALLVLLQFLGWGTERFQRLNFLVDYFVGIVAVLLIVIFQPELRQAAIRLGQTRLLRPGRRPQRDTRIDAIAEATAFLSRSQFGAIIAIERHVRLGTLVESGQVLDARLNPRVLESIFWPNSPLHDLGVVIRGERILAAGVQFPLAEEGTLPPRYGSRHRAAAGLSAESDCVVVVVSEETGTVSLAFNGKLDSPIPIDQFALALRRLLDAGAEVEDPQADTQEVES
jgi:diadenylate cyclase